MDGVHSQSRSRNCPTARRQSSVTAILYRNWKYVRRLTYLWRFSVTRCHCGTECKVETCTATSPTVVNDISLVDDVVAVTSCFSNSTRSRKMSSSVVFTACCLLLYLFSAALIDAADEQFKVDGKSVKSRPSMQHNTKMLSIPRDANAQYSLLYIAYITVSQKTGPLRLIWHNFTDSKSSLMSFGR